MEIQSNGRFTLRILVLAPVKSPLLADCCEPELDEPHSDMLLASFPPPNGRWFTLKRPKCLRKPRPSLHLPFPRHV